MQVITQLDQLSIKCMNDTNTVIHVQGNADTQELLCLIDLSSICKSEEYNTPFATSFYVENYKDLVSYLADLDTAFATLSVELTTFGVRSQINKLVDNLTFLRAPTMPIMLPYIVEKEVA
jgi:hypothetical protein